MTAHPENEARILVVDDESSIVRLLVRTLEAGGYSSVQGISDSTKVPAYLDSVSPDLVILDLNMPGLDGFQLLAEISARLSQDTFLPVLAVSGSAGQDAKERAFQAGAKDFLVKPISLPDFLLHVQALLDTRFLSLRLHEAQDKMERLIGYQNEKLERSDFERQRAEERLRQSELKFRTVADFTYDWEYWMAPDGRLVWMSPSSAAITGYSSEEFMVSPDLLIAVIHPDDRESMRKHLSKADSCCPELADFRIVTRSGDTRWVSHRCQPVLDSDGSFLGRRASNVDISDRKAAEQQLADSLRRLQESEASTIQALSSVTEHRDPYTAGHQQRVAAICVAIARRMGLSSNQTRGLQVAALLHDVGKVSVPIEILSNPGPLSVVQRMLVEGHVATGHEILRPISFPWPVAEIVLQHHERLDGSGYPAGLRGDAIILEARILAVADTVEAMTSHRPYRAALGLDVAVEELVSHRGVLYDDAVVDAYVDLSRSGLDGQPHLPDSPALQISA